MKKFKSILSMLMVSILLFGVAAAGIGSASAAETLYEGIYHYTVTDGKATITDVVGAGTDVTVPATLGGYPVTTIGKLSFREEGSLRTVVIPASVETIEESAFTACVALESVTFEDNSKVKALPKTVFNNNKSLKTIDFGSNSVLETIGESAFWGCSALETFNPPATLKTIGATAFEKCTSLKDVTITKNVKTIGDGAFAYCEALEKFKVDSANEDFTTDSWGILYNKDRTTIVAYPAGNKRPVYAIPAYIENVEDSAFMGAIYLEDLTWLNPFTRFGISAFSYCTNLYRVTIPEGTAYLKDWMFNACFSLTEVNFPDSLDTIDAGAFHWCTALEHIELPEGIFWIGPNAFKECYALKSVVLPESLTEIGSNAFSRCFSLEEINIPENVGIIGQTAFYQCYSLKEFTFPEKMKNVNSEVLRYCYGLEQVNFSSEIWCVDDYSLQDCTNLKSVYIPASVGDMNGSAFINCISLESVDIDENSKNFKNSDDGVVYNKNGSRLVYYPAAKDGSVYVVPNGVTSIGGYAFANAQNLTTVVIPATVTHVQTASFDGYNIRDIYFEGTEEQWNAFQAAKDDAVKNAEVHFNYNGTDHVHSYSQTMITEPTCDRTGRKLFACDCGESKTVDFNYSTSRKICLGGNYVYFDGPDSDCNEKGKGTYSCSKCAKILDTIDKAKLAHEFEVSVSEARVNYRCKDCEHEYNEPIPEGARYAAFACDDSSRVYILNPGEKLAYPVTPVKEGLDFAAWIDAYSGERIELGAMPDRNLVLRPLFEKFVEQNEYGVTARFEEGCFEAGTDVEFVVDTYDSTRTPGAIMFMGDNYESVKLFDICFKDGSAEVQPKEGKTVEVSIPVPEGYENCEEFLVIHRHSDGEYEKFTVKATDGKIVFKTEKFSEFELFTATVTEIGTMPSKLNYTYKDSLDMSGFTLKIIDAAGNVRTVSDTSKMKITGFDSKKIGTQTVTVEHEGATVQFNVTVSYSWWQMLIRILFLGFLWY